MFILFSELPPKLFDLFPFHHKSSLNCNCLIFLEIKRVLTTNFDLKEQFRIARLDYFNRPFLKDILPMIVIMIRFKMATVIVIKMAIVIVVKMVIMKTLMDSVINIL